MKSTILAVLMAAISSVAMAGEFQVFYSSECQLMSKRQVYDLINEVGIAEGLSLRPEYHIAGTLRCFYHRGLSGPDSPVLPYTFRVTIEKQVKDGNKKGWMTVSEWTSWGVTDGTRAWHDELRKSVSQLIRQYR